MDAVAASSAPLSRRTLRLAALLPAALAALWAPSFAAEIYDGDGEAGTAGSSYLARPDRGWQFLYDAVRLSRGPRYGTEADVVAATRRDVWSGHTAKAERARLVYGSEPFRVQVPPGGTLPPAARAVARPRSALSWLVEGSVNGGPVQPIGLVDYHSGRIAWDILPLREGGR